MALCLVKETKAEHFEIFTLAIAWASLPSA